MKAILVASLCFIAMAINSNAQSDTTTIPENFIQRYYDAYSGVPTAERLSPFYHNEVVIDDPNLRSGRTQ